MGQNASSSEPEAKASPHPYSLSMRPRDRSRFQSDLGLVDSADLDDMMALAGPFGPPPAPKAVGSPRQYLNRNSSESFHRSLATAIAAGLCSEDLQAEWFFPQATRPLAHEYLARGKKEGTFLIRPSSHRGLFAVSWMKKGLIQDNIVYSCFPGYSLQKKPAESDRFVSLSMLVEHCKFLKYPCPGKPELDDAEVVQKVDEQLQLCLKAMLQAAEKESVSLDGSGECSNVESDVRWELEIIEERQAEKRTLLQWGRRVRTFPALCHVSLEQVEALGAALKRGQVKKLALVGAKGHAVLREDAWRQLAALIPQSQMQELDVRGNMLGDGAAEILGGLLRAAPKLRSVDARENCFGAEGLKAVTRGLRDARALERLCLSPQWSKESTVGGKCVASMDPALDAGLGAVQAALSRREERHRIRGMQSDEEASALLGRVRSMQAGLYVVYLHPNRPDACVIAYTNDAGGHVVHRTVYRHNAGYSWTPCLVSLTRHAAWRLWADGGGDTEGLGDVLREQVECSRDLFYLTRCENLDHKNESADAVYPTLLHLIAAHRGVLKMPLNKTAK